MRRVKKSRGGCSRCKSKRVKCGEERPECQRCVRLGVKCPGYVQPLRWVTKYETFDGTRPSPSGIEQPQPKSQSQPDFNPASKQSELGSPLLHSLLTFDDGSSPNIQSTPQSTGLLGATDTLCDSLWGLQSSGSLPELADLDAPLLSSPTGASPLEHQDPVLDYALPIDDNAAAASSLTFCQRDPEIRDDNSAFQGFSPSNIVRSYPPPPQKLPRRDFVSIHRPLNNPSWTLIEYYFKEVAALFSSYDSHMNPFRTTVSRLWGSSLAICRAMQSMAAATLVNDFPQFGPLGLKMRNEAVRIITSEAVIDDKSLLALLMLGQTASWHDPRDLGVSFFNMLRKHLDAMFSGIQPSTSALEKSNNYRFFEEALVYWEMLLSFVADNDTVASPGSRRTLMSGTRTHEPAIIQKVPHPWTGIARDTQSTVQEVGRLVRLERKRVRKRTFTSQADIVQAQKAISKAQELEERLLNLAHPSEAEIVSPGDNDTPVWHLLTMAEVYRCTGLLQLYRTFPDLLRQRLPFRKRGKNTLQDCTDQPDPLFPFLGADMSNDINDDNDNNILGFRLSDLDDPTNIIDSQTQAEAEADEEDEHEDEDETKFYDDWLTKFALTTLARLRTIPLESRTRCLQPFLLVASCSELRLPQLQSDVENPSWNVNVHDGIDFHIDIPSDAIEVSRTRKFVLGRLTSFLHVLPPKPIDVCLRLVQEVWSRMDRGEDNVYWVDVMIEKGWETTMG